MRITAIAARTVRWPIASTGAARGRGERAAVLLEVRSDTGLLGLGEAAPLPGMSRDTLDEAEQALAAFAALAPFELAARRPETSSWLPFELVDPRVAGTLAHAPPSARFAIETALCDALARALGVSLATLLHAHVGAAVRVPLSSVVDDPEAARRAYAAGVRSFKIKLTAEDPVDRAFAISAAAPGARLRIDANRSWPVDEVPRRLAALAPLPIEYVEEPCRDAHRLLAEPLPCKLALDESLAALSPEDLAVALRSGQLAAVVLKPTVLGGLSAVLALAARARGAGVAPVASHALEGPIGTAACAELALALAGYDAAVSHALEAPIRAVSGAEFALAGEDAVTQVATPAAGLAAHAALAGWLLTVAQIAGDHLRAAAAPGLGFAGVDLATAVRACPAQGAAAASPTDAHPDAAPGEAQRG